MTDPTPLPADYLTVEIRIFLFRKTNHPPERLHHYMSPCVPREGELICVQSDRAKVYHVEWTVLDGKSHADVFCAIGEDENG